MFREEKMLQREREYLLPACRALLIKHRAWVWGKDDYLGRVNLLTPQRVATASKEIKTGEIVPLNLPLDVPKVPAFNRQQFKHEIKALAPGAAYDDIYTLNTQSGTQVGRISRDPRPWSDCDKLLIIGWPIRADSDSDAVSRCIGKRH